MHLIRLLTDFDGRIGLRAFWLGSAIVALVLLGVRQAAPLVAGGYAAHLVAFAGAFALYPWAALAAKRSVDRGGTALFGILLVCAIVLPGQLRPLMPTAWAPSLDTIPLIAWVVALIDLGLMPGERRDEQALAAGSAAAKPAG